MFKTGRSPQKIVKARDLGQISDASALEDIVTQILRENPGEVAKFMAGKETVFQWLMGQVARATKGKADPQVARALLTKALAALKAKK
jgi:aspartyl-tRNA(Asn)/glutamyl-tRNA(Gln) amidotransferase subunit B